MHIREIRRSDLPALTHISYTAFLHNELNAYIWPHRFEYKDAYIDDLAFNNRSQLTAPGQIGFVALLDAEDDVPRFTQHNGEPPPKEGDIVGKAWYVRFPDGNAYSPARLPRSATLDDDEARRRAQRDLHRNMDILSSVERRMVSLERRYNDLVGLRTAARDLRRMAEFQAGIALDTTFEGLPSHWNLKLLGVDPRFQGRGVGSLLMKAGKELAMESGVPLCLTSAAGAAYRFYREKEGMRVVGWAGAVDIDADGGAHCVWDPWGRFLRPIEPRKNAKGKLIDGEWVA